MAREKKRIALPERTIGARQSLPAQVIKSAGRTLEIFELFDRLQRDATIIEISVALGYPQSSCAALLRSLTALGYLYYDRLARTFIPTSRVAMLGAWVNSHLFQEGRLMRVMRHLSDRTGDAVILATRNGLHSQYVHVVQATNPTRLHVTLGATRPIANSGTGYVLLSQYPDDEIRRIVLRVNAEAEPCCLPLSPAAVLKRVQDVRRDGYAFTMNLVTPGGGVLAMKLPTDPKQPALVLGIGGISVIMAARKDEIVDILREAIRSHFTADPSTGP